MSRQFVYTLLCVLFVFVLVTMLSQFTGAMYDFTDQVRDASSVPMQIQNPAPVS